MAKMTHAEWTAKHAEDLVGWTMLDEYQGTKVPIRFVHFCGTERKTSPNKFLEGRCLNPDCMKAKKKKTNLKKYGVEEHLANSEIRTKIEKTNLEKYGGKSPLSSPDIRKKIEQTNLDKYGVKNVFSNLEIQEEIEQTNLERYGGHPMRNPEIKAKIDQTNLERYGGHPMRNLKIKNKIRDLYNQEHFSEEALIFHDSETLEEGIYLLEQQLGRPPTREDILIASEYLDYMSLYRKGLAKCDYNRITSKAEEIAKQFFKENQIQFIQEKTFSDLKDKGFLRFDFYLPEFNILIELDGEFHDQPIISEERLNAQQKRDEIKNEYCRAAGIPLIRFSVAQMGARREYLPSLLENLINDLKEKNNDRTKMDRKERRQANRLDNA